MFLVSSTISTYVYNICIMYVPKYTIYKYHIIIYSRVFPLVTEVVSVFMFLIFFFLLFRSYL